MSVTNKTIGGVSILGLIVFAFITFNRNNKADELRNEQLKSQQHFRDLISQSKESSKTLKPFTEPLKDLMDSSECFFNPIKIDKSFKINVNIAYPCRWEKMEQDIPSLVAQYVNMLTDTTMVAVTANIVPLSRTFSSDEIDVFNSEDYLKSINDKQGAEYLKSKKITVDNVRGSETLSIKKVNEQVTYFRTINLYYKSNMLVIKYSATSPSRYTSDKVLRQYEKLFDKIRDRTNFIN